MVDIFSLLRMNIDGRYLEDTFFTNQEAIKSYAKLIINFLAYGCCNRICAFEITCDVRNATPNRWISYSCLVVIVRSFVIIVQIR